MLLLMPVRVVSLEISGGKFLQIYSNHSGNLLNNFLSLYVLIMIIMFPSPALQSNAVK